MYSGTEAVWHAALGRLEMEMNPGAFNTWVRGTWLVERTNDRFVVSAPNAYAKDWLEHRLRANVKRVLSQIVQRDDFEVHFVIAAPKTTAGTTPAVRPAASLPEAPSMTYENAPSASRLSPKYTFSTFVVGSSNRLAHAACVAASENPAKAYNPIFLYGGVGLGKTHLLHGVGNACAQRGLQVLYVSSEEFGNDLINAIRTHTTEAFREKYRRADVLLIDDIQFIAGKESMQEEFFHTFNTLHGQDKQLVISSDRPPKAMVTLEERLRSRFEWGLTVDIQPPDFETRQAILRAKAERAGRNIDPVVFELIARRVQSNIRELEGALTRVMAYADLTAQPISLELATAAIADLLPRKRNLDPDQIITTVAEFYGTTPDSIFSDKRTKEVAWARQVAMFLIREETELSLPAIGRTLGNRDHTTIMYGCDKVADMVERDDATRRQMIALREKLHGG